MWIGSRPTQFLIELVQSLCDVIFGYCPQLIPMGIKVLLRPPFRSITLGTLLPICIFERFGLCLLFLCFEARQPSLFFLPVTTPLVVFCFPGSPLYVV